MSSIDARCVLGAQSNNKSLDNCGEKFFNRPLKKRGIFWETPSGSEFPVSGVLGFSGKKGQTLMQITRVTNLGFSGIHNTSHQGS
jgi:hypothetical protein